MSFIQSVRKKGKLSVQQLASLLGVPRSSLWAYESGQRTMPGDMLDKLARLDELFKDYQKTKAIAAKKAAPVVTAATKKVAKQLKMQVLKAEEALAIRSRQLQAMQEDLQQAVQLQWVVQQLLKDKAATDGSSAGLELIVIEMGEQQEKCGLAAQALLQCQIKILKQQQQAASRLAENLLSGADINE